MTRAVTTSQLPNADGQPWVSGATYTAGKTASVGGVMYTALTTTSGTTSPASDPANWVISNLAQLQAQALLF